MGRHASAERRRGIAAWPVVVGVAVLLLIAATVVYVKVVNGRSDAAACSGTTVLPVVAGPAAAPAIEKAAQAFNATKPVARSSCVAVSVTSVPGAAAVPALTGGWRNQRTPAPGLWIADTAADVAALDAANPAMTAGHPTQPLATSPVVLAVRQPPASAVSWASLAAGSSGLTVGIGPAGQPAATAALESLVRGASAAPAAATGIDTAAVGSAGAVLARLAGSSSTVPATTDQALAELAAGNGRYTAVPALESELAVFNDAKGPALRAVHPTGPTAGAAVLPVPLTAAWVSSTMSDAAAAFDGYLGNAAGTAILTAAHLRTAAAGAAAGVDLRTPVTALPDATPAARAALTAAWASAGSSTTSAGVTTAGGAGDTPSVSGTAAATGGTGTPAGTSAGSIASTATPSSSRTAGTAALPSASATTTSVASTSGSVAAGPAITFLVDTSGSMTTVEDGAQRFTWVKAAISTVMLKSPGRSFGLWSFATTATDEIPLGPRDEEVVGTPRSSAIIAALNTVKPAGDSHTYGAIRTAVSDAAGDVVPGGVHRVVLLTDGFDSTPGLSRSAIKAAVATLVGQHPGLTLDIIGLSPGVNDQALTEIAAAGGGTFTRVDSFADLEPRLLAVSS